MKRRIEVEEEYKTKLKETEKLYKELKKMYNRRERYWQNKEIENQRSRVWREQKKLEKLIQNKKEIENN
jgi:hypothetical protein